MTLLYQVGGTEEREKAFSDTTFFRLLSSGGDQPVELRQRLCLSSVLHYNKGGGQNKGLQG